MSNDNGADKSAKITLGDVAREAGVAKSTASEALTGSGRMTDATRRAVREAAQRLGYRPNALARGLRTGRTHSIGLHRLHAPDNFDSEYFRELIAGVMDVAITHDYDLSLLSSNPVRPRSVAPRVDGIILADPIADDLRAIELLNSGIPVVAGERYPPGMPTSPVVGIAHETALTELLEHAYRSGARRPALFAPDEKSGWGVVLRDTFLGWCRERGLPGIHRTTAFKGRRFREDEGDLLAALLTGTDPVDLVVVPGEHAALATREVMRDMGLQVGRDVLLAVCADAHLLELCEPPITAIDLSPRRLGATCAQALVNHLDHGTPLAELTLLEAHLTLRNSTERLVQQADTP
ncbi:LacI family DNA-binding transcriptional regulator [Streptomyces shenzhenensis]